MAEVNDSWLQHTNAWRARQGEVFTATRRKAMPIDVSEKLGELSQNADWQHNQIVEEVLRLDVEHSGDWSTEARGHLRMLVGAYLVTVAEIREVEAVHRASLPPAPSSATEGADDSQQAARAWLQTAREHDPLG